MATKAARARTITGRRTKSKLKLECRIARESKPEWTATVLTGQIDDLAEVVCAETDWEVGRPDKYLELIHTTKKDKPWKLREMVNRKEGPNIELSAKDLAGLRRFVGALVKNPKAAFRRIPV